MKSKQNVPLSPHKRMINFAYILLCSFCLWSISIRSTYVDALFFRLFIQCCSLSMNILITRKPLLASVFAKVSNGLISCVLNCLKHQIEIQQQQQISAANKKSQRFLVKSFRARWHCCTTTSAQSKIHDTNNRSVTIDKLLIPYEYPVLEARSHTQSVYPV